MGRWGIWWMRDKRTSWIKNHEGNVSKTPSSRSFLNGLWRNRGRNDVRYIVMWTQKREKYWRAKKELRPLLPLAKDTARKVKGKLGVIPPKTIEARGEPNTAIISSSCSTRGDPMGTSKDGNVTCVDEGTINRLRLKKAMSSSSYKWSSSPSWYTILVSATKDWATLSLWPSVKMQRF